MMRKPPTIHPFMKGGGGGYGGGGGLAVGGGGDYDWILMSPQPRTVTSG